MNKCSVPERQQKEYYYTLKRTVFKCDLNLASEIEWSCKYAGSPFQEVGAENEEPLLPLYTVYEQEQEADQPWQIGVEDVPQLHQPAYNVLQDNLVPIRASTCMSWHTVYMLFAVGKWASATVFSCGPWHLHDQEVARWVELQISKQTADVWLSQLKLAVKYETAIKYETSSCVIGLL